MKKKAIVIGNCQAYPLNKILSLSDNFLKYFELESFPAVHVAKEEDVRSLRSKLDSFGLVISQPISDSYRGGIGLGNIDIFNQASSAVKITFPSL